MIRLLPIAVPAAALALLAAAPARAPVLPERSATRAFADPARAESVYESAYRLCFHEAKQAPSIGAELTATHVTHPTGSIQQRAVNAGCSAGVAAAGGPAPVVAP